MDSTERNVKPRIRFLLELMYRLTKRKERSMILVSDEEGYCLHHNFEDTADLIGILEQWIEETKRAGHDPETN